MKELEKTKRISIAATLFILAVIIGLLTYKRPKNIYAINTKDTLEKRLKEIAALLVKFFTFDQCAVYLLDQEKKILNLAVELEFRFN